MAKADTIKDIKTANGQDVPDSLTQKQLGELLTLAERGDEGRSAFDAKLTEFTSAEAEEDTSSKIRVRVTDGKGSGSYIHPESKQLLRRGGEPVLVPNDDWTDTMIRNKYLTEIRR
ncbi:hypothetical protein [Deinococcus hopiensis]|uniref:Uncharacterized protein n=1 Tax=Deinococcus hopiensis KR-140 TaxID=695939 RepID=A0A1W1V7L6_9DEIO|nr:hypothetical protein [Deinococcus hopiensis]SMB89190.1 hypothetical protein SAMN00790413_00301 [Deinococcus hopiensis KR-140]